MTNDYSSDDESTGSWNGTPTKKRAIPHRRSKSMVDLTRSPQRSTAPGSTATIDMTTHTPRTSRPKIEELDLCSSPSPQSPATPTPVVRRLRDRTSTKTSELDAQPRP